MNRTQRWMFRAICAAYLLLGTLYSVTTPVFEASDELWHYPMVDFIARNQFTLPVQDAAAQGDWRQEGSQPPLYYLAAAALTAGIDTSDLPEIRRLNPHADIGIVRPDGNANMIVHQPQREAFPYRGAVLAVHIARLFSVALGLGTVIVTGLLARELFPDRPTVILGATALNAFLPMFLFISGSVNNDNASNLLGNLLTLMIVRLTRQTTPPRVQDYIVLGAATGLGLLAKLNIGFLIPLIVLALILISVRQKSIRPFIVGGLISGALTIAIAGWWYVRNLQLYGDPTGLNVFLDIVGRRAIPANAAQLWAERFSFTQAFWGYFGGLNVPYPVEIYRLFDSIGLIALVGIAIFLVTIFARRRWSLNRWLPALITLIWIAVTFISYLRWTAETPASQGRLVFGALSSICIWLAVGLTWWQPPRIRPLVMGAVGVWFLSIAVITPFWVIMPSTTNSQAMLTAFPSAQTTFSEHDGAGRVAMADFRIGTPQVQPEDYFELSFAARVETPFTRDWSLFVHLVTPDGVIIAQRDVYPASGTIATTDLADGEQWLNEIAVFVPPAAYAPMTLDVLLGWYHLPTGERMRLPDGSQMYRIGTVDLLPRHDAIGVPNPIRINFGGELELVGYSITDLTPNAGDSIELTLYWRRLRAMTNNYVVFAHIIDPASMTIYAGSDAQPAAWTAPTSSWAEDAIIEDMHTVSVNPDTPSGIYELEIGLYTHTDGRFDRLRVVTADGGMANDYAYLTRVRVMPRQEPP